MTSHHPRPITPPLELIQMWSEQFEAGRSLYAMFEDIYRAGADAELEACCEWFVRDWTDVETADELRAARRPNPPSLKEQALDLLNKAEDPSWDINDFTIVRRALEQLP
jgi:hypothetical protein